MRERVALINIGDELLAGHTRDSNMWVLANALREHGAELARVIICTDEVNDLVARIRELPDVDWIVTSGGLGPTPDDRTMLAIAEVTGLPLVIDPAHAAQLRDAIAEKFAAGRAATPEPNEGHWKMIRLPAGSEGLPNRWGTALGCCVAHGNQKLITLPGVPSEFEGMMHASFLPRLRKMAPEYVGEYEFQGHESPWLEFLQELELRYPNVKLGSYPEGRTVRIRGTGPKEEVEQMLADVAERVQPSS